MKIRTLSCALGVFALLAFALPAMGQSPLGVWLTFGDDGLEARSEVEIYEQDGLLLGRILRLLPEGQLCSECADEFQDSDLVGFVILNDMQPNGDEWSGGNITDPESGRTYNCKMELDSPNRLKVRGFVGISLLGRTQVWERVR